MQTEVNFHFPLLTQLTSNVIQLVIVDTTAAPALYIVGQWYSFSLCSSLKYTDS